MEWHAGRPQLKLIGYRSAEEVADILGSFLVDVAYVVDIAVDAVYIVADDPAWPTDAAEFEWMCDVIRETLASHGISGIELSLVPPRVAPERKPDDTEDPLGT